MRRNVPARHMDAPAWRFAGVALAALAAAGLLNWLFALGGGPVT